MTMTLICWPEQDLYIINTWDVAQPNGQLTVMQHNKMSKSTIMKCPYRAR